MRLQEWVRPPRHLLVVLLLLTSASVSVPKMEAFTLHPDNRRFAFSVNEGSQRELWVLEGLVRPLKVVK